MNTKKNMIVAVAALLTATATFAQRGLGLTKSVNASVTKSVQVQGAHGAATRATAITKGAVHTTANGVDRAKGTAADHTRKAVRKTVDVTKEAKTTADKAANARVNAQASVHASENAKAHANDNSALFGLKSDVKTNADVTVDAEPAVAKVKEKGTKTKEAAKAKKDEGVAATEKAKKEKIKKVKEAKGKAGAHVSAQGEAHANTNASFKREKQ